MNEAQRLAIKNRQRKQVAADVESSGTAGFAPPEPPPAQEPFEDVAARARERLAEVLDEASPRRAVAYLRFTDKTFQLPGMQSGEQLAAAKKPNGQEHAIELVVVAGASCFLVWYLDPPKREVRHEFVERSAVKTWRLA